jgi:hypothetical protein
LNDSINFICDLVKTQDYDFNITLKPKLNHPIDN